MTGGRKDNAGLKLFDRTLERRMVLLVFLSWGEVALIGAFWILPGSKVDPGPAVALPATG